MTFHEGTYHLAIGTTQGELIMLELNQKQKDITRLFKGVDRYSYPDESTAVIIQDIAFVQDKGESVQLLVSKDVSAKTGDALEFFLFDKNRKVFKRQNEIEVILPEIVDTNGVKYASADAMFFDQDTKILYIAGSNLAIYSADLNNVIKGNSQRVTFQLRSIIPPNTQKRLQILKGREGGKERITSIALSPDKKYLATGLFYGDIYLLDLKETDLSKVLKAESTTTHYTQVSNLDFYPNNYTLYLAASSFDHSISLINMPKALDKMIKKQKKTSGSSVNIDDSVLNFKLHHNWVHGVQFFENPRGELKMLSISEDGSARIWWAQEEDLERALKSDK